MTLDAFFGPGRPAAPASAGRRLGMVIGGSLSRGLDIKLDPAVSIEAVRAGQYVTVHGETARFFCVVSDLQLEAADPALAANPPDLDANPIAAQALRGIGVYGVVHVVPVLTGSATKGPVRTVPPHHVPAYASTKEEIEDIFGSEDDQHLWIGTPLDMEHAAIRLNLPRLIERSSGVFGKSGTGKTFLTRILMAGILQKDAAVQLIFDMHNEYGWVGTSEGMWGQVKGLKQLYGARVAVLTLDEASSRARGVAIDGVVHIALEDVTPEDIEDSAEALGLNETQEQAVYRLQRRLGRQWIAQVTEMDQAAIADVAEQGESEATLRALQRRLQALTRLDFFKRGAPSGAVNQIIEYLERGMTVVLEFGRYRSNALAQVLVANMLSRRIYQRWSERVERALAAGATPPPQLVITLEEAHKFLNPRMAGRTIFGEIAREMRKYNVTLLVVDQRPSAIDSEVLSQIGTKVACLLEDEKDVSAVLGGVSGGSELRGVLARLESKQQALIFGHAVPMPVVVRTRDYGSPESYRDFGFRDTAELAQQAEQDARDLFGP